MSEYRTKITELTVNDVRFPTSMAGDGSDAVHEPDYSCAYVVLKTDSDVQGYGLTFTLGRGNEIVCLAVDMYRRLVVGRDLDSIYSNFSGFWREMTQDSQMRWLGPEKGVTHIAAAAIINALWDLWARLENKPLWKLLADMTPEQLVSTMDFTYIDDVLTKEEAIKILKDGKTGQTERELELSEKGFPAYTTSVGWLGYSDEKIKKLCEEALADGFTKFKVKVGANLEDDMRRVGMVRKHIGKDNMLMVDANQRWGVQEAVDWMKHLTAFNLTWIEEPTSPDDVLGHAYISKSLAQYGVGVATGECCQNRVMFKQFFQSDAMQYCQIDSCRMAGPNEIMLVILMAAKFNVPVCPHAGGVGLCELVQHLAMWDYISVAANKENRVVEYVDHLHEHFVDPVHVTQGAYQVPKQPGYSTEMKPESMTDYTYPSGRVWKELLESGRYTGPM